MIDVNYQILTRIFDGTKMSTIFLKKNYKKMLYFLLAMPYYRVIFICNKLIVNIICMCF